MKTVVVTGGVRGIGRAIAEAFLQKQYRVCVCYSKDEEAAESARAAGLEVYRVDVRDERAVADFFKAIGKVDILVNNAGVSLWAMIQDTTAEQIDEVFAINVRGTILCCREALKSMLSYHSGLIVNISSVWGEVGGCCESVYSASKGAVLAFTKALAKEVGYSGIRVNAVSPGMIETKMNARFTGEDLDAIRAETPAGRFGRVDEVAQAVLFLEENEYITGIDLPINGGFSIV